jgi:hypothetical protein
MPMAGLLLAAAQAGQGVLLRLGLRVRAAVQAKRARRWQQLARLPVPQALRPCVQRAVLVQLLALPVQRAAAARST